MLKCDGDVVFPMVVAGRPGIVCDHRRTALRVSVAGDERGERERETE
jgi:hypothetical protein